MGYTRNYDNPRVEAVVGCIATAPIGRSIPSQPARCSISSPNFSWPIRASWKKLVSSPYTVQKPCNNVCLETRKSLTWFSGRVIMEIAKDKTVPWVVDLSTTPSTADRLLALNDLPMFLFGPCQALVMNQRLSFFQTESVKLYQFLPLPPKKFSHK